MVKKWSKNDQKMMKKWRKNDEKMVKVVDVGEKSRKDKNVKVLIMKRQSKYQRSKPHYISCSDRRIEAFFEHCYCIIPLCWI